MSKILARFKRAASTSSDDTPPNISSPIPIHSRSSDQGSGSDDESHTVLSSNSPSHSKSSSLGPSSGRTTLSGSHFIEEFGEGKAPPLSPLGKQISGQNIGTLTPSPSKHLALDLPDSASKGSQPFGTPKLVLTDPGSNSPRSFSSSPGRDSPDRRSKGLGLGLGTQAHELYSTSSDSSNSIPDEPLTAKPEPPLAPPIAPRRDSKSNISVASAPTNLSPHTSTARDPSDLSVDPETRKARSSSIISRLKGGSSPKLSPTHLDVKPEKASKRSMDKEKRSRRMSTSSGKAKSIASAIVEKAGHSISGLGHSSSTPDDAQSKRHSLRSAHNTTGDSSSRYAYDDDEEDEDDSGSELDDDLPVTGFAVASNRRNADFHALFPTVDEGDYLIEDYGCALSKDILVQGRLYVSENHICFHANIFGWVTDVVVPFNEIRLVEKKMTALVIPNAIGISTGKEKYTFASFLSRDTTYDVMMNIWRLCNPNAVMSSLSLATTSRPASIAGTDAGDSPTNETAKGAVDGGKGHSPTKCTCGKDGKHYSETALETTLSSTPEKIYNLMFASEWVKTFLTEDQKLRELEMSDWKPIKEGDKLLTRTMSYIKPLNGSIGPKQTKCHIVDEQDHYDEDSYISTITTTKTPDVPSGGVFSVKTRTCLMWAGANSTKVVVTTTVEWTGKSWVKGIIEKSCIDGQKQYQNDLAAAIRKYMKEHQTEFGAPEGEGADDDDATAKAVGAADGETQTEAEAYAAKNRKKRMDDDKGFISGGIDTVLGGFGAIGSGLSTVFSSVGDLLSDLPVGKEVILGTFILLLLASNVYTYFAFRERAPERLARRAGRENELSEVVRLLLEQSGGVKMGHKGHADPQSEVSELMRMLDDVEGRAARLRSAVAKAGQQVAHAELD